MGTRYVQIPLETMRQFITAKNPSLFTEKVSNDEIVFDFPHPSYPSIIIRIFTGISKSNGQSRGCGRDALRVAAIDYANPNAPRGYIKSLTAYRTQNWQANLRDRTQKVIHAVTARKTTPFQLQGQQTKQQIHSGHNLSPSEMRAEQEALRIESRQW